MLLEMNKTTLIAEIGLNANGNVDIAIELMNRLQNAGWDVVKFQKRDIDLVYTEKELISHRESPWGKSFRQQKEGIEFGFDDYIKIDNHSKRIGLPWTASAWDFNSIDFLTNFDIPYLKIPSALVTNREFLRACCHTQLPLHVSTGMCDVNIIQKVVELIIEKFKGNIECLYHCTSTYPCDIEEINLKGINNLKAYFPELHVGYSGHERSVATSVMAAVLGAKCIERHVTLDRTMYGSDQAASLEPKGFQLLARDVRTWERARGNGSIEIYDSEKPIIDKLRRVNDIFERA